MDILNSLANIAVFALAVAGALFVGSKLLPAAELLFTRDCPEDSSSEA